MEKNPKLFERQFLIFDAFMAAHASVPKFWDITEGGPRMRELTGPRALIPVTTAMLKLGMTESQAWDMSMGKLQWYCAEASELEGGERRFLDDRDIEETKAHLEKVADELPPEEIAIPLMTAHYGSEAEARKEYAIMKKRKEATNVIP